MKDFRTFLVIRGKENEAKQKMIYVGIDEFQSW
jgi:hypothetical protein